MTKAPVDKNGTCLLCGAVGALCKSHIISDAIYRRSGYTKEGKVAKRFSQIQGAPDGRIKAIKNSSPGTGVYERLLCRACEDKRQRIETRFIPPLFDSWLPELGAACQQTIAAPEDQMALWPMHADYATFRLFFFWTFWLAAAASGPSFADFQMEEADFNYLRQLLLTDDPGPSQTFRCYLAACPVHHPDFREASLHGLFDVMHPPELFDLGVFRMMAAGLLWFLNVGEGPVFPFGPPINVLGEFGVEITNQCFTETPHGSFFGEPPSATIAMENLQTLRRSGLL